MAAFLAGVSELCAAVLAMMREPSFWFLAWFIAGGGITGAVLFRIPEEISAMLSGRPPRR